MPLIAPVIQLKLESQIFQNLKQAIPPPGAEQEAALKKMATAIADAVVSVIIGEITSNAMVLPGQAIVGAGVGAISGVTVSPGQIA